MPVEPVKSMQEIEAISAVKPVPVGASQGFQQALQEAVPSSEYTGGVPLVEKDKLINVPMLILGFVENEGVGDATYVYVRCMLPNDAQVAFNDGGVGIAPALIQHATSVGIMGDEGRESTFLVPMYCPRGLRKSEYTNESGIDGTTYYLS